MSDELLIELMQASRPYLRRKKFTPRHECDALNEVWKRCEKKMSQLMEAHNES